MFGLLYIKINKQKYFKLSLSENIQNIKSITLYLKKNQL
jgi:hypothetical protein